MGVFVTERIDAGRNDEGWEGKGAGVFLEREDSGIERFDEAAHVVPNGRGRGGGFDVAAPNPVTFALRKVRDHGKRLRVVDHHEIGAL